MERQDRNLGKGRKTYMIQYPDLSQAELICFDIETKDPELKEKGTSVYRGTGHILGVGLSDGVFSEYYDLGHPGISPELRAKNLNYVKETLANNVPKIGTNILYDMDWLVNGEHLVINGKLNDVIVAESLINEYRPSYSLDSLAQIYLGEHKRNEEIQAYCDSKGWKGDPREHLWKMSWETVRSYVLGDVEQPIRIFKKQWEKISKTHKFHRNGEERFESLEGIYDIEMRVHPALLKMRKNGVRVNKKKLIETGMVCQNRIEELDEDLERISGIRYFNPNSGKNMTDMFKKNDIPIVYNPPTDKMVERGIKQGNPSFKKGILKNLEDKYPEVAKVLEDRHYKTIMSFFVNPYPRMMVGDKLHCNFYPTKRDEGGTVTGRYSSSKPNLQQVSSKKEDDLRGFLRGQIIRKCFIPLDGYSWLKNDWSQIEYRIIAHYAIGPGADEIRSRYNNDPNTDYHDEIGEITGLITHPHGTDQYENERKITKTLNFGTAYSMGAKTMAVEYGWDIDYAYQVFDLYHNRVPFIKETSRVVGNAAKSRGFIKTILGRHCHMPSSNKSYVMFNRLIQGSAADVMKKAMVDAYEAGLFGGEGDPLVPHLTVHDEMDCSIQNSRAGVEAGKELQHIMEHCVDMKVPIICDSEVGTNWGSLEKFSEWSRQYEN